MFHRTMIPRRVLYGNPARMAPRISPDGNHLAWLQPRDGVMNLWVAPVDEISTARPLTRSTRPLLDFGWTYDGRHLLFFDDPNGNENQRIWAITRDLDEPRMLTPEHGVAARLLATSVLSGLAPLDLVGCRRFGYSVAPYWWGGRGWGVSGAAQRR